MTSLPEHPVAAGMQDPSLELSDIQGDVLIGLQKDAENFVFFEIADVGSFKGLVKQHIIRQITSAQEANRRDFVARQRKRQGQRPLGSLTGLNLGLTKEGYDAASRRKPAAPRPVLRDRGQSSRHGRSPARSTRLELAEAVCVGSDRRRLSNHRAQWLGGDLFHQ